MDDNESLKKFREHIENIHLVCHKTVNRAIDTMTENSDEFELLSKFTKELIIMERLCEYLSSSICNSNKLSKYAYKEYVYKCEELKKINKKMVNTFEKDLYEYLRCDQLLELLKVKKKKKTKKRYSRK